MAVSAHCPPPGGAGSWWSHQQACEVPGLVRWHRHEPTSFSDPAYAGLTAWLGAMASWEWNVECCVCRAPFPASLTAQAHANDQYYWSTIDGLATKQEKLITTKALLCFNYWISAAISAAQRHGPILISNKMWCRREKKYMKMKGR